LDRWDAGWCFASHIYVYVTYLYLPASELALTKLWYVTNNKIEKKFGMGSILALVARTFELVLTDTHVIADRTEKTIRIDSIFCRL
jgi:hypothetical protein